MIHHKDETITDLHERAASPPAPPSDALLDDCWRALTLAMAICDATPTRAHVVCEGALKRIGELVNAQDDGTHGYAFIRDTLASLSAYLKTVPDDAAGTPPATKP